ncbi:MAG: hypothetical protein ACRD0Y_02145 [Terriglobales bacterium]
MLAGIDQAFEKFDSGRRRDTQRHRSLVYCAAAVLDAAAAARAAAVGAPATPAPPRPQEDAFSPGRIRTHLENAVARLTAVLPPATAPATMDDVLATLRRLAATEPAAPLEDLDRVLTACDEKLLAALTLATPVAVMTALRADLDRDLAPYRRRLRPEQLAMIERQFLQRRLLEHWRVPRLSLFYLETQ